MICEMLTSHTTSLQNKAKEFLVPKILPSLNHNSSEKEKKTMLTNFLQLFIIAHFFVYAACSFKVIFHTVCNYSIVTETSQIVLHLFSLQATY